MWKPHSTLYHIDRDHDRDGPRQTESSKIFHVSPVLPCAVSRRLSMCHEACPASDAEAADDRPVCRGNRVIRKLMIQNLSVPRTMLTRAGVNCCRAMTTGCDGASSKCLWQRRIARPRQNCWKTSMPSRAIVSCMVSTGSLNRSKPSVMPPVTPTYMNRISEERVISVRARPP